MNPLVVMANYAFDTFRSDNFRVRRTTALLLLHLSIDRQQAAGLCCMLMRKDVGERLTVVRGSFNSSSQEHPHCTCIAPRCALGDCSVTGCCERSWSPCTERMQIQLYCVATRQLTYSLLLHACLCMNAAGDILPLFFCSTRTSFQICHTTLGSDNTCFYNITPAFSAQSE